MSQGDNGGERKMIEINPHLLAHTLKNAGKKRTKKNKEDEEDLEGLEDLGERKTERKTRIRMNEQLGGGTTRRNHRYERKSLLREYRKKQEELLKEGGGESLIFSNEGGESKLILHDGGSSRGLKVDTTKGAMNDFSDSVQFMKHLEKEIMEKANEESMSGGERHNHTVRKKPNLPTPEYGCLKGGTMPTFREWTGQQPGHRTTQRMGVRYAPAVSGGIPNPMSGMYSQASMYPAPVSAPIPVLAPVPTPVPETISKPAMFLGGSERESMGFLPPIESPRNSVVPPLLTSAEKEAQERAREINEKLKLQQLMKEREETERTGAVEKRGKRKKTIRRKLHTGKINDRVSILIPNKTIRNRFHNLSQKMHQTSIQDIKKYLLKRGFIKVGTSAPHEILRKMYKDLHMLGGELQNLNGENIVYNFKAGAEGGSGDM
jgi:hypothetical protein